MMSVAVPVSALVAVIADRKLLSAVFELSATLVEGE
jgi:hypothetical protein